MHWAQALDVGARFDGETLAEASPIFRAAGVRRVEYDHDGSVRSVEWYPPSDTIPCPPPLAWCNPPVVDPDAATERPPPISVGSASGIQVALVHDDGDPHPECLPDDEEPSDAVAREVRHLLCAAAVALDDEPTITNAEARRCMTQLAFPIVRRRFR